MTLRVLSQAKWRAFAAIGLAYITIVLSTSLSFVVLSSIAEDFDVTLRAVGWVVIIESLIVAAFVLPLGGIADVLGRRRVLFTGMVVFAVGTVLTGLAPTFELLIAARVVMAGGNALAQSVGTGMLVAAFPPHERGLAMGAQTTAVAVGSASGPLLGGFALEALSWDVLFVLLAIPSAAACAAIHRFLDDDAGSKDGPGFDRVGGALSAVAIVVTVVTVNNPFELGWRSFGVLAGGLAAAGLIVAFVRWELRHPHPMLELRLFVATVFRNAVLIRVLGFFGATTAIFLMPVYLLSLRDISEGRAGIILFLNAVGLGVAAQVSGRMYDAAGPRSVAITGLVLQILILTTLATADETTRLLPLAVLSLLGGFGVGLWNVPMNSAMMGATPRESFGVGGAFTNVTRTFGNVFGQAVAAAVVAGVMASDGFDIPLGDLEDTPGAGDAFLDGWRIAFFVAAGVSAVAVLLALLLPAHASSVEDRTRS